MATLSSDVTAALASLRTRWGEAAPRFGGDALGGPGTVVGALATVPFPDEPDPGTLPARPSSPSPRAAPRTTIESSGPGSRSSTRSSVQAGCPARRRWPCAGRRRAARRPSPSGSRRRPRRRARSSPTWTSPAASTRSRRSPAASGSSGSSSSSPIRWTRRLRWPARWSRVARSTSSSSTCRPNAPAPVGRHRGPDVTDDGRRRSRIGSPGSWRSPGGPTSSSSSSSRPAWRLRSRARSPSRPVSGSSSRDGPGSGSAGTSSASGRR